MGRAVGEILAFGIGVSLSPIAIVATVLMVVAPGGRRGAVAFIAAWLLSLAFVGALALLVADGADASEGGAPADWASALQLGLAALLVAVAARQWRGRPSGDAQAELPRWIKKVDGLTPARAVTLAVGLAAVKPKNLLLTIGAAVAIAETGVEAGEQAGALAIFVLLGTLGPGLPLAISLLMGERAVAILDRTREWMIRENATIVAVLCLVFAAKLAGDAVSALAG